MTDYTSAAPAEAVNYRRPSKPQPTDHEELLAWWREQHRGKGESVADWWAGQENRR